MKKKERSGIARAAVETINVKTERGNDFSIGIIQRKDPNYPALLREIQDPPESLYYIGNPDLLHLPCAAVVGTRKPNTYGLWAAGELGKKLAKHRVTVVSGMAKGIDAAAHKGAVKMGSTIAVLGCGIDWCYPAANRPLRDLIAGSQSGLILSEYPPGTPPAKYMFPRRNRIISGLSDAVVVVQAGSRSGALITAELAAEQGRNVYALPGNINSAANLGNNKLLKDGAIPLVVLDDLLEEMGIQRETPEEIQENLGTEELKIYRTLLQTGEQSVDELCRATGYSAAKINGIVTVMEIKGVLFTALGKVFVAN